ncbi:MAG: hypothetical protein ACI4LJ_09870 [Anaerovoracaceae bacterium]
MKKMKKTLCILLSMLMVLAMMPGTALAVEQGLAVMWNGNLLYGGDNENKSVIEIPECCGESLQIYFDGVANDDTWAFGKSADEDICYAGVSQDNRYFEVYLNSNAKAGESCDVTLFFGNRQNPIAATYRIVVVPGVRLKKSDDSLVYPNGSLGGSQKMTVQLTMGNQNITQDYTVGTNGNTVLKVEDMGKEGIELTPVGNGSADLTVTYEGRNYSYKWTTEGLSNDAAVSNVEITLETGKTIIPGNTILMEEGSTVSGSISLNGQPLTEYTAKIDGNPNRCKVQNNEEGTFTLTSFASDGYCQLVISFTSGENHFDAVFEVQVQSPKAYILQFYNMEKQNDGSFIHNGGFATIGIFMNTLQDKYTKFIVTDQNMRRVGEDHFVNVTPASLEVLVYDKNEGHYVNVQENENPFTITQDDNDSQMLKIHYDRSKDKHGPAYMLVYTDYEEDMYLQKDSPETPADNTIFLWTRSVADFVNWDKISGENHHWWYDASVDTYEGFEKIDEDYDVKHVRVDFSSNLFGDGQNQIAIYDETDMEITTDLGTITFDDAILHQIDDVDRDVTLSILDVDAEDKEYQEVANALENASCIVDLKLNHENGTIHEFGDGTAVVKLKYQMSAEGTAAGKKPYVYYVDSEGAKHLIECQYDAATGTLTFSTNHFSLFEVEEVASTPTTPSTPGGLPSTSTDKVTQSGDTTTADLSGSTTSKGGETTTTVDQTTADKMVETAVKNNSEEIVINAVTKNESAASSTKADEVVLTGETLQTIAEKTDADVVVKTNVAEVKLDNKTAEAVASQTAEGETVSIIAEKVKEEAKEVQFELKIVTSSGKVISDFDGGNVAVTVNVPKSLQGKKLVCVYIDDNGYMHKVEGTLNADGTYTFNTGHFSTYALMDEGEAEAAIEAQKEAVKALKPTLRSSQVKTKSGKKAVKLTWKGGEDIQLDGIEIYRSLKKSGGYGKEPFYTTTKTSYLNTSVKAGKRYYYKVRGFVTIDGEKVYTQYSTKAWRTVK